MGKKTSRTTETHGRAYDNVSLGEAGDEPCAGDRPIAAPELNVAGALMAEIKKTARLRL